MKNIKDFWSWISNTPIIKSIFVFVFLLLILFTYLYLSDRDYVDSNPTKALFIVFLVATLSAVYAYIVEKNKAKKERSDGR